MANFVFPAVVGDTTSIHTTLQNPLMTRAIDTNGNEWLYMLGVASTVEGSWVTYDENGVTALLVASAIGPVAVAGAATVASTWGWYCVKAQNGVSAMVAANTADNTKLGFETTAGHAGDGKAAGDEIYGAMARGATSGSAALATVQINNPFVDDVNGA